MWYVNHTIININKMAAFTTLLLLSLIALGNAGLAPKIIGGTIAKPGEIPYQISLQMSALKFHFCGGSILDEHYVITAAYCSYRVKKSFVKSLLISFVPLPLSGEIAKTNDPAMVSGFGTLTYEGKETNLLHKVSIKVADQAYCNRVYKNAIHDTQFCAYDLTAVKGHCDGDSGGSLMVNGKLHGIVSWSMNCADVVYPSVYTRVTSYLDWIKEHAV